MYDHPDDLVELGVIEKTREVRGSAMYQINRDSTVAEDIAQLEWDLLDVIEEFVDDDGCHYYVIQFEDDSGRILRKQPTEDDISIAEFTIRDEFGMEGMRRIASATDFEVDGRTNTRQNLRNPMKR